MRPCSKARPTFISRASRANGFCMKSSAPSCIAWTAPSTEPWAVITMTSVESLSIFARFRTSRPSLPGILRSVSTRSKIPSDSSRAHPSSPSFASTTSYPDSRSATAMPSRRLGSSSTRRIFFMT